jgi:hypothetical protein
MDDDEERSTIVSVLVDHAREVVQKQSNSSCQSSEGRAPIFLTPVSHLHLHAQECVRLVRVVWPVRRSARYCNSLTPPRMMLTSVPSRDIGKKHASKSRWSLSVVQ